MKQLTDRYVYAVTKLIPDPQKQDIEKELRGLIEDMIEQKGGYSEKNETEVLKELGHPRILADKYLDRPHYLIGPELFGTYISLLKVIIPIAIVATLIGNTIDYITNGKEILDYFATSLAGILNGAMSAFGWITLIFAVIERNSGSDFTKGLKKDWDPKDLPEIEKPHKPISRVGTLIGIGFTFLFMILLNKYAYLFGIYYNENGTLQYIPVLNAQVFGTYLPFINCVLVLQVLLGIAKLIYNRWTYPIAAVNLVINVFSMVLAFLILSDASLIDVDSFRRFPGFPADAPANPFGIARDVLMFLLPLSFAFDSFEGFRNAYKSSRGL